MVNFDVLSTALIRKEVCFHSSFSLVRHHVDVAKIKNKSLKISFFPAHSKGSNNYLLSVTYKYGLVINMSLFSPKRTKVKNNKKEPF